MASNSFTFISFNLKNLITVTAMDEELKVKFSMVTNKKTGNPRDGQTDKSEREGRDLRNN